MRSRGGSAAGSACDPDAVCETAVDPRDRNSSGSRSKTNTAAMAPTANTSAATMARAGSGVGFGEGAVVISLHQEYFLLIPCLNVPSRHPLPGSSKPPPSLSTQLTHLSPLP